MGKVANFDGKLGSFGNYGGSNIKNSNDKGWYITECSICGATALYYVKDKGYCKLHYADAIEHLKKVGTRGIYVPPELDPELELDPGDFKILKSKGPSNSETGLRKPR